MTVEVLKPAFQREAALQQARGVEHLPIRLELDGRSYVVSDLSEGGFAVVEFDGQAEPGQIVQTTLILALEGFDIAMPALWEVVSHVPDRAKLSLHLSPTNPPSHLARINTVFQAILAGNLDSSCDLLEIAGKKQRVAEPDVEPIVEYRPSTLSRASQAIRRRIGAIFFLLLAAVLLAFIGGSVASRTLTIQADGTIVNAQAVLARAPENAELVSYSVPIGTRVRPGNPIAIVKTLAGVLTVVSPCDCVVGGQLAPSRAMVRKNDPLAQLVPIDGANKAVISVPKEALRRVRVGDQVTATFYDTDARVTGTVERVSPPKVVPGAAGHNANSHGTVEVRFSQKLPAWRVGEPVIARILLSSLNPFA